MKLVVVGGQSRNLGKTALVCDIVRTFVDCRWTAIKITQWKAGECPVNGANCGCGMDEHRFAISEEKDRRGRGDSCRFLAAGAARALWVRVKAGQLEAARPAIEREMGGAGYAIVESNSILEFAGPDLYLIVLDPATRDFKVSARKYLDRADAIVLRSTGTGAFDSDPVLADVLRSKPRFVLPLGAPASPELLELVRARLFAGTRVR